MKDTDRSDHVLDSDHWASPLGLWLLMFASVIQVERKNNQNATITVGTKISISFQKLEVSSTKSNRTEGNGSRAILDATRQYYPMIAPQELDDLKGFTNLQSSRIALKYDTKHTTHLALPTELCKKLPRKKIHPRLRNQP